MTPKLRNPFMTLAVTPSGPKMPVLSTVLSAFEDLGAHWRAALRLSWVWAALVAIFGLLAFALLIGAADTLEMSPWLTLSLLWAPPFVFGLFAVSAAVGWHRLLLLGEDPGVAYVGFGRPFWRYVWAAIIMGLLIWLVSVLVAVVVVPAAVLALGTDPTQWSATRIGISVVLGLLIYVPAVLVASRLAIALPARAIGERMRFREAFAATRGNALRILAGSLLISVPMIVVQALMNLFLDFQVRAPGGAIDWLGIAGFVSSMALALAALVVLTLASVGFLTRAYQFFAGHGDSMAQPMMADPMTMPVSV